METKKWQKKKPPTDLEKQVGKRIRECRERVGLATDRLADLLGVSSASIVQYELGVRSPSIDRLSVLTRELGITADYLICGSKCNDTAAEPKVDQMVKMFNSLTPRDRDIMIEIMKAFLKAPPSPPANSAL